MDHEKADSNRLKATILFFALERGLARVLRSLVTSPSEIPEPKRLSLQGRARLERLNPESVSDLITVMYFQEVVEVLAALPTAPEVKRQAAKELLSYVEGVGLHDVRLACAHQTRPWKPNYLAIVEAVCLSEPVTVGLEVNEVAQTYSCVQRNTLEPPPEDWIARTRPLGLPNNLAAQLRAMRNATFVGRSQERAKLRKQLLNARTNSVCIVGPGGIGKTAFALKVLSDLSFDTSAASRFDRILFVSGKQRSLSASGVIRQTPDFVSLDELRLAIALELGTESFDECADALAQLRLLLCVDNVEDLVGAHPACLEDLQENLPLPWVLLTTSRVPVPAQFSIPLPPLGVSDLHDIATERLRNAGIKQSAIGELAELLAKSAPSPLALTVAADLVSFGGESAAQAIVRSTELTAEFAFSSLLDLQTPTALGVLDAVSATSEQADLDAIATLLHRSRSEIDVAVVDLRRANLLAQAVPGNSDLPELVPAVRDLVSRREVSTYGRDQLYREWCLVQRETRVLGDTTDHGMPANEARPLAKRQLIQIRERVCRSDVINEQEYADLSGELRSFESQFGPTLNSLWIAADLAERRSVNRHEVPAILERAMQLDSASWLIRARLAKLRFEEGDFIRSADLLRPLVFTSEACRGPIPERSYSELFTRYFQSRTYFESDRMSFGAQRDTSGLLAILDELQNISNPVVELNRRLAMATVLRRMVERTQDSAKRFEFLNKALSIVDDTFEERGVPVPWWCNETTELLSQFVYASRSYDAASIREAGLQAALKFAEQWAPDLLRLSRDRRVLQSVLHNLSLECPDSTRVARYPAHSQTAVGVESGATRVETFAELARLGFIHCTIYAPPNGRHYCFAKDERSVQYYLHRSVFDCDDARFDALSRGAPIAVLPESGAASGRAVPALSATLL